MTHLLAKSIYRGYDITNNGIVGRIFLNGTMVHYGEMSEEQAHSWINSNKKELSNHGHSKQRTRG